jgi:hypothetical protein
MFEPQKNNLKLKKTVKFSLFKLRRRIEGEELQLHSFLKSAEGENEKSNSYHPSFDLNERTPPPYKNFKRKFSQNTTNLLVQRTLVQALRLCTDRKAHGWSRVISLPLYDHGNRRGIGINFTP